ncbi:LysE family translocator [Pleomorphomonas sp. PLEO]|uniref:LysE family translocator n=1 Tax=Pleomorphomonas sp. PLEO TaxID=3239306 RepID=UPI00351E9AF9
MNAAPLFLMTSLALVASPGPNTLSLTAIGAAFGTRRGVPYMIGLDLGMVVVVALVGSGLWAVMLSYPGVGPVVTVAASLYLIYLAFKIATAPPLGATAVPGRAPGLSAGVTLSLTNPKAYVSVAAVVSRYTLMPGQPVADELLKGALFLALVVAVNVAWLAAGSLLGRIVTNPRVGRAVNLTFAAVLVVSVAAAFL